MAGSELLFGSTRPNYQNKKTFYLTFIKFYFLDNFLSIYSFYFR